MKKTLTRSKDNKIVAGIFGGIGKYFDIDPTLLRLPYLMVVIFTGIVPGLLTYILALFVIPPAPAHEIVQVSKNDQKEV